MFFRLAPPSGKFSFTTGKYGKIKEFVVCFLLNRGELCSSHSVSMWVGWVSFSTRKYCHSTLPELVSRSECLWKYIPFFFFPVMNQWAFFACVCPVPVRMVCGSVRVWLALLSPLPVWNLSLPVPGGVASPPSGCVTTRMTVVMVQMRSARPPALQTNSAVPACQGQSKTHSSLSINTDCMGWDMED